MVTPENVECQTCEGEGYVWDDEDGGSYDCPDCDGAGCTPENVECRTCNGQRTWTDSDDGDWFACPDCWTPENVDSP